MNLTDFFKKQKRICNYYTDRQCPDCSGCPIYAARGVNTRSYNSCDDFILNNITEIVSLIEKWEKEHPAKTRQSALLEAFPNAPLDNDGVLILCPHNVGEQVECIYACSKCRKKFWMEEVE